MPTFLLTIIIFATETTFPISIKTNTKKSCKIIEGQYQLNVCIMVIYRQLNNALVCRPTLTNSRFRYYFGLAYFASLITKLMLEFSLLCRNLKLILADLHNYYFVFRMFFSLSFNSIDLHWGEN